ncbi:MAG: hypothetical protein ACD_66C00245G0002 [uncultured bacterium]|nr:MAG: hypothetical protein ACD_66C00245G0002 [uncultured bacterium]
MSELENRLNQIEDKIKTPEFLTCKGIGNEIAFYIFDYEADKELHVKKYTETLINRFNTDANLPDILHIDLFYDIILGYLKKTNRLDRFIQHEKDNGSEALLDAASDILKPQKLCAYIVESYKLDETDIIFISGVGAAWPFIRAHSILSELQNHISSKPVVLFYPGNYISDAEGHYFVPFGNHDLKKSNYYRAFHLVPYQRGVL